MASYFDPMAMQGQPQPPMESMPPREPCPDRILDDVGGAFGMGAIGGSAFHFLKGVYNSPKGERFLGGSQAIRMNAPRVGGSFAVWGGLYSSFDCTMVYLRQKEDPWNSILAGASTGGLLSMRQGLRAVTKSALAGGVILALIEGAGIAMNKLGSQNYVMEEAYPGYLPHGMEHMQNSQVAEEGRSSWFGGFFGDSKKQEEKSSGSKTEVLESFDSPGLPIPSFDYK